MKTTISLSIFFILISCANEPRKNDEQISEPEKQVIDSASTAPIVELIDSSGVIPGTDWEKHILKGIVKSTSIHSETIDEEGEPYGMGGNSESREYSRLGLQVSAETSGCCGAAFTFIEYKYNKDNQLTHRIIKESEDWFEDMSNVEMTEKEKYFYNENGVLVKKKIAGADKVLTQEHRFKFNDEGVLMQEVIEDVQNGDIYTTDYRYENLQNTIITTGASNHTQTLTLNDDGLITFKKTKFGDGNTQEVKYVYEFDEHGNWILRTSMSRYISPSGEKEEWKNYLKETRQIQYFE